MKTKKKTEEIKIEKGIEEMTTAEILATIDAGDYEPEEIEEIKTYAEIIDAENDDDDELIDPPAEKKIDLPTKELEKLANGLKDENGKYYHYENYPADWSTKHPGWNPTHYIGQKNFTTVRIGTKTFEYLTEKDLLVETTKEKIVEMGKEEKKKLAELKKQEKEKSNK